MAISPEQIQTFDQLSEDPDTRVILETAREIVSLDGLHAPGREHFVWEQTFSPTHRELIVINLRRQAISIAIRHSDIPIETLDMPASDLYRHPQLTFGVSISQDTGFLTRGVYTADSLGRPSGEWYLPSSLEAFQEVFAHTTAQLGLYHQIKSHELGFDRELSGQSS